jgi:hypothetical protein
VAASVGDGVLPHLNADEEERPYDTEEPHDLPDILDPDTRGSLRPGGLVLAGKLGG